MKPVRRRIRRHFGLTAKQVAVRSQRPWYFQVILAVLFVGLGFASAYWMLRDNDDIRQKLQQATLENKELQAKLVGAQRELQVELATNNNLAKELASVQDETIKIKEDLFFYKNMVSGKRPK
ncbi:MAG: hypothetical protein WBL28_06860 [Methylotenera sp.]